MLTEQERDKIKAEEIYREEVRKTLAKPEKNKLISFLNTNFGLFILSTVLVGLISFLYTKWDEARTSQRANADRIESLSDEVIFRISQVDKAFADVDNAYAAVSKKTILGKDIQHYATVTSIMSVTCKMSGIISFPPPLNDETNEWIGTSGFGTQHLPYKRGFKNEEYQFASLEDLLERINALKKKKVGKEGLQEFRKLIATFDTGSDYKDVEILNDWFQRRQANPPYAEVFYPAYSIDGMMITDYSDEIARISLWVEQLHLTWNKIRESELVAKNVEQFFID